MEKPKRARRRKPDTAEADLEPPLAVPGGQGVHREVESERSRRQNPGLTNRNCIKGNFELDEFAKQNKVRCYSRLRM